MVAPLATPSALHLIPNKPWHRVTACARRNTESASARTRRATPYLPQPLHDFLLLSLVRLYGLHLLLHHCLLHGIGGRFSRFSQLLFLLLLLLLQCLRGENLLSSHARNAQRAACSVSNLLPSHSVDTLFSSTVMVVFAFMLLLLLLLLHALLHLLLRWRRSSSLKQV